MVTFFFTIFTAITNCDSCKHCKRVNDWFRNQSTVELLESAKNATAGIPVVENINSNASAGILPVENINSNASAGIPAVEKIYEKRDNVPIELRGYYIHRLLVNHVAMWASPTYAWYIMKLLEDIIYIDLFN